LWSASYEILYSLRIPYGEGSAPDLRRVFDRLTDDLAGRPWTVDKKYVRGLNPVPDWIEFYCTEGNNQIAIGKDNYFLSGDGMLMPTRKDQPPPDLRYFKQRQK
jgi:hypothetical protein